MPFEKPPEARRTTVDDTRAFAQAHPRPMEDIAREKGWGRLGEKQAEEAKIKGSAPCRGQRERVPEKSGAGLNLRRKKKNGKLRED